MMNKARLSRAERGMALRRRYEAQDEAQNEVQDMNILERLIEVCNEQGGPEGLSAWLSERRSECPPGYSRAHWPRLLDKITDMARVWCSPEDERGSAMERFQQTWASDKRGA